MFYIEGKSILVLLDFSPWSFGNRTVNKADCLGRTLVLLPYQLLLYSSIRLNALHDASEISLARWWFFIIFATRKPSTQITWFSLISVEDSFCKKSFLRLKTFSWIVATFMRCFSKLCEFFTFLESERCARTSRSKLFFKFLGFSTAIPLLSV